MLALRGAVFLLTLLLALPLAGGLPALAPHAVAPAVAPLPADLSDGDLVLLLARHAGIDVARPTLHPLQTAELQDLLVKLARRSGAANAQRADFDAFERLDPRIAVPVSTLLAAIDQAWDLRDRAVQGMTADEQRALAQLVLAGRHDDPRAATLAEPIDRAALVQAAILLLDAAEGIVIPRLQEAAELGVWPAEPIADDIGVLRIGGTGDDTETIDRLLQIDARGNDTYLNNAGGTTLLADLKPETLDYPIAMSVDLRGDDSYSYRGSAFSIGSAFLGVGILAELQGNDRYDCLRLCMGAGSEGAAISRDYLGDDTHFGGDSGVGYGTLLGISRDDGGADTYRVGSESGGFGWGSHGTGLLWDRRGADVYGTTFLTTHNRYGWGANGGRGYFPDEGIELDSYLTAQLGGHGCNNCTWTNTIHGHGNDNAGGLGYVLLTQDAP